LFLPQKVWILFFQNLDLLIKHPTTKKQFLKRLKSYVNNSSTNVIQNANADPIALQKNLDFLETLYPDF